jgi:hypothetical protein
MGLFGSKPFGTPAYKVEPVSIDPSAAFYPSSIVEAANRQSEAVSQAANMALKKAASASSMFKILGFILFVTALVLGAILIYDNFALTRGWNTVLLASPAMSAPPPNPNVPDKNILASPPLATSAMNYIVGSDSSGDLLGSPHLGEKLATIRGSNAVLSAKNEGAYGVQWWMFIKDWNYGFGKDKAVIVRADPTNLAIKNPAISLHPTENTLKVSISIFPANGQGSVSEPAAAGHAGSTDDVFVCEVPDVPLQKWFAVSVTVFGRNLDVYIDGKLVKSCFLSGVPKPVAGDISVTPDGGFSGKMCSLYHYSRMLVPSDAKAFFNAGTSCQSDYDTTPYGSPAQTATGYSVKFGMYDKQGNAVKEYAF